MISMSYKHISWLLNSFGGLDTSLALLLGGHSEPVWNGAVSPCNVPDGLLPWWQERTEQRTSWPPYQSIPDTIFLNFSILGPKTASPTTTTTKQTPSTSISSIQVKSWFLTSFELHKFLGMGPDPFGEVCRDTKVNTILHLHQKWSINCSKSWPFQLWVFEINPKEDNHSH